MLQLAILVTLGLLINLLKYTNYGIAGKILTMVMCICTIIIWICYIKRK